MKSFAKKLTGAALIFAMTAGLAGCGSGKPATSDSAESSEATSSGEFDENS